MDEWLKFEAAYEGWTHVSYGTFCLWDFANRPETSDVIFGQFVLFFH